MKLRVIFLISVFVPLLFLFLHRNEVHKQQKNKSYKAITIHPFECRVYVFTDSTEYREFTQTDLMEFAICETSQVDSGFAILITDSTCLDHELIHLTWFIFQAYDVPVTSDNQELQAYFFEYIKSEINK